MPFFDVLIPSELEQIQAQTRAVPTSFTIVELGDHEDAQNSEDVLRDLHVLNLTRRALPYRPFTLKGSQRNEITWYPGNPIGSLQVLGPTESDTSVSGVWKDVFIKGSNFATLDGV